MKVTSANGRPIVDLRDVVKRYTSGAGDVVALKGIDLQVERGEFVVITGKSGSGKTTLVNMITGLDRLSSGEAWVAGVPLHRLGPEEIARWRGERVGVVFQTFELLPSLTVLQNVMLPMDFAGRYSLRERRERALYLLEQVGIAEHAPKLPSAVSGGQRQRIGIARALANDPPLIVADEPTGSLDSATAAAVMGVFERMARQGKTVLVVTHDLDLARCSDRVLVLRDGVWSAEQER
jgi:putative ABC transport system ATP-binding protein